MNATNATPEVRKIIKFDRAVSSLRSVYRTSNSEITEMVKLFSADIYSMRLRLRQVRSSATPEYFREYVHFVHIPEVRFLRATVKTTMRELFYRSKGDRLDAPRALAVPEYTFLGIPVTRQELVRV